MFKIIKNVILILIVILVMVFVFRNTVVKFALEQGVKEALGLKLQLASVDIPFSKTSVGVKGLRLFNPPDFPDPLMIKLPEIYVAYDLPAILKKDIHLQEFRMNLEEVTVIRDKNGNLNLDVFKKFVPAKGNGKSDAPSDDKTAKNSPPPAVRIDLLVLKVGKVTFKDYSKSEKVIVKEFVLNIDQRMSNVTDINAVGQKLVIQVFTQTDILKVLGPEFQAVGGLFGQAFKSTRDLTTGTVKTTTDVLKNTVQGVSGVLSLPFQKGEPK